MRILLLLLTALILTILAVSYWISTHYQILQVVFLLSFWGYVLFKALSPSQPARNGQRGEVQHTKTHEIRRK